MTRGQQGPSPGDPVSSWAASAYGLTFRGQKEILGLSQGGAPPSPDAPQVEIELLARLQSGPGAHTVISGTPGGLLIEADAARGHRMSGPGMGRAAIAPDARSVAVEPPEADGWLWNRWVLSQVLPFVAALHGRELLHAGAVVIGGRAVAILGPSGVGKSTLVAALLKQGARFLADDVVALETRGDSVVAHPGPGLLVLGTPQILRPAGPSALDAVCLLEEASSPGLELMDDPPPQALLGNVYERVRRDPGRLEDQLALLSRLAVAARFVRIQRAPGFGPDQLAVRLVQQLGHG